MSDVLDELKDSYSFLRDPELEKAIKEIERLRDALREIGKKLSPEKYDNEVCLETYCGELARAALGEGKE
jgi:hypothetical protein